MIFWNQFQYLLAWACGVFAIGFMLLALVGLVLLVYGAMVSAATTPERSDTGLSERVAPNLAQGTKAVPQTKGDGTRGFRHRLGSFFRSLVPFSRRTPKS